MTNKSLKNKSIASFLLMLTLSVVFSATANADCIKFYGGGEVCSYSNRFRIEKKVRVPDEDQSWEDKVLNVADNDIVEFRVVVENRSDDSNESFDDFEYKDLLPSEMERVGGDDLKENWDDFEPGEVRTYYIKAKLKGSEFDKDEKFEKCIVNKVELYWDDDFEDSDIASVCYGSAEVTELPETGPNTLITLSGIVMLFAGFILNKKNLLV